MNNVNINGLVNGMCNMTLKNKVNKNKMRNYLSKQYNPTIANWIMNEVEVHIKKKDVQVPKINRSRVVKRGVIPIIKKKRKVDKTINLFKSLGLQ